MKKKIDRYLYNDINIFGINNFVVDIIEECENNIIANEREKYWIKKYDSNNDKIGYNLTDGGDGGNTWKLNKNKKETSTKISIKLKGHVVSEETIRKISNNKKAKGFHMTEEQKEKISNTLKKKYKNGEIKSTLKPHDRTGEKHSVYSKKKMSEYRKNKTYEEIYGEEMAILLKEKRRERMTGYKNNNYKHIDIEEILEMINNGFQNKEIAEKFNVTPQTIWKKLKENGMNATQIRLSKK